MRTRTATTIDFDLGFKDGKALGKTLSPADIRQRLVTVRDVTNLSAYGRGFTSGLESVLTQRETNVRRGQGGTCHGTLTIRLQGPQGSGKGLVARVLACMLPLLPLQRFEVIEEVTE